MPTRRSIVAPRPVVLGAVVLVAVIVAAGVMIVRNGHQAPWTCRAVDVAAGTTDARTADAAVGRFLDTGAAPRDGWSPSEPNRWSRQQDRVQMVLDIDQHDVDTFAVVRFSTCGPGGD